MPFSTETFLEPIDENTVGPNGEAPGRWNGNLLVINELCKWGDAASLKELLRGGRLVKPNGELFLAEGEELPDDDGPYLSDPESDVLTAMTEGGVLFFDDLDRANPRPRLIRGSKTKGYTISKPLNDADVMDLVEEQFDHPKEPQAPTGFTVWWDKVLRFFGGRGTETMCRYRSDLEAYRRPAQAAEKIRNQGIKASGDMAASNRSGKKFLDALGEYRALETRYKNEFVPSAKGNQINELRREAAVGLNDNYRVVTTESRIENRGKMERNLATMVALDLILRERVAAGVQTVGDGKTKSEPVAAGPLETRLNEVGYMEFIDSVRKNPSFQKAVQKMTHRGLGEFLSGNRGVDRVSREILDTACGRNEVQPVGKQPVKSSEPMVMGKK